MSEDCMPKAIIIGSMKSGTTGLARDLSCIPGFFCPKVKEPEDLCHDEVLTDRGLRRYRKIFADAKPTDITFEASTAYTKFPLVSGVPNRTRKVLGKDIKIVFIVRSPLDRAKSHLRHEAIKRNGSSRKACAEFTLDDFKEMHVKDISDYRLQLDQWLECFDRESIMVVSFEDYVERKIEIVGKVAKFISGTDISSEELDRFVGSRDVENSSFNRQEPTGFVLSFLKGDFYLRVIKPIIGSRTKNFLKYVVSRPVNPQWKLIDFDLSEQMHSLNSDYSSFIEDFVEAGS